ncbi:ankyrin repeat domain-containing protein [Mariniblastus sp.]|nr:ankyrin repeat domain-containing protein [Mariniblastus sp.]
MKPHLAHAVFAEAIESGDVLKVKSLIQSNPKLMDHPDWTPPPLHCAILWDQPKIVEVMLESGADLEMLDPDRRTTPLRYAILYCKIDLIPILLLAGANYGAINGMTSHQLAVHAAAGGYEEFDDLTRADEYQEVIHVLNKHGIKS